MDDDRRRYPRLSHKWGIRLRQIDGQASARAETDNLSDNGMYCISDEPFSPGDRLECEFFAPGTGSSAAEIVFRRRAIVVRLEVRGVERGFGIACEFEERAVSVRAAGNSVC